MSVHASNFPENHKDTPQVVEPSPKLISRETKNSPVISHPSFSVSSHSLFNKLANPLEKYIYNFQPTDGLDINLLLQFLRNLVKIQSETKLTSQEIYEILPGYCEGPLLCRVIESKRASLSIDQLHSDIFNSFIPITLRE